MTPILSACHPLLSDRTLLTTLPYWRLDSNQRLKLSSTGIDDISIHRYVSVIVSLSWPSPLTHRYYPYRSKAWLAISCCRRRVRTSDLKVMSLASYHCSILRYTICSLVVDSNSRFTILSPQVNALYEFPVSYNHIFLIFQRTFFLICLTKIYNLF